LFQEERGIKEEVASLKNERGNKEESWKVMPREKTEVEDH